MVIHAQQSLTLGMLAVEVWPVLVGLLPSNTGVALP